MMSKFQPGFLRFRLVVARAIILVLILGLHVHSRYLFYSLEEKAAKFSSINSNSSSFKSVGESPGDRQVNILTWAESGWIFLCRHRDGSEQREKVNMVAGGGRGWNKSNIIIVIQKNEGTSKTSQQAIHPSNKNNSGSSSWALSDWVRSLRKIQGILAHNSIYMRVGPSYCYNNM